MYQRKGLLEFRLLSRPRHPGPMWFSSIQVYKSWILPSFTKCTRPTITRNKWSPIFPLWVFICNWRVITPDHFVLVQSAAHPSVGLHKNNLYNLKKVSLQSILSDWRIVLEWDRQTVLGYITMGWNNFPSFDAPASSQDYFFNFIISIFFAIFPNLGE